MPRRLSRYVEELVDGRSADPGALAGFLKTELAPHTTGEQKSFYPAMEPVVREHGRTTATMSIDHEFMADYIGQIDAIVEAMRSARPAELAALEERLRRLAIKLEAIMELHNAKEERVYLPLFAEYVPEEEQRRIQQSMDSAFGGD